MHASTPLPRDATAAPVRGPLDAAAGPAAAFVQDEADAWIGYESFHPLTWLPAPGVPQPGMD